MTEKMKNGVAPAAGECVRELRAEAPVATTYQLVEILTPAGKKAWQFTLTTPNEIVVDNIRKLLAANVL